MRPDEEPDDHGDDEIEDGVPPSPGKGRPPLTSQQRLLEAARRIGFRDLTVTAMTDDVGVKYSTFYRHWPNLASLVGALMEETLRSWSTSTTGPPRPAAWPEVLAVACAALAETLDGHPGMADVLLDLTSAPEPLLRVHDRLSEELAGAGFSEADARAVVATALRTTIASATGATAHLRVPAPDVGLPAVVITALQQLADRRGQSRDLTDEAPNAVRDE